MPTYPFGGTARLAMTIRLASEADRRPTHLVDGASRGRREIEQTTTRMLATRHRPHAGRA